MSCCKPFTLFFISIQFAFYVSCLGQAPLISYVTPQVYQLNTAIPSLVPTNKGGVVPATIYGQTTTFAGGRAPVTYDATGTGAGFNLPSGIGTDGAGNIYVSDYGSGAIRKITPGAVVTTIANVNTPSGLTLDNQGNIYITDFQDNYVYKISSTGVKSIFAGNGSAGSADGTGSFASFNGPGGITSDAAGNLYLSDQQNNKIREISPSGVVTTFAGSGTVGGTNGSVTSATFNNPDGLAIDQSGNLYVADTKNNSIRKITAAGVVTTLAGSGIAGNTDGLGSTASFNYPTSISVDVTGNLYVADYKNNLIRKITPQGLVSTIAGNGSSGSINGIGKTSSFSNPLGILAAANGNLYITDFANYIVRQIVNTGYTIDKQLPAGLSFDSKTGIISGTPTVLSPATDYIVTAFNASGSSATTVNISVLAELTVSFPVIASKTVCDIDFDPGATGGVINYTSSNIAVATIVGGKIHITGAGTSVITASNGTMQVTQTLTVSPSVMPSITITPTAVDGCQGAPVTFTAVATNPGSNPIYSWQVNGKNTGATGTQFTVNNLGDNDKISCVLNSNAICVTNNPVTSNVVTFTLDVPVSPSVTITSSAIGPICPGTVVNFTATASPANVNATFQWQINGNNTGTNSATFTSNGLSNNDVVTCVLSSQAKCLVTPDVTSNAITITINQASSCVLVIPNTFTPNGDGINDLWNIPFIQNHPDCNISIYNRYGAQVYNSIGYSNAWNGTYNGKAVPA